MVYDVFVSYSRSDMQIADKISKQLKSAGLNIFIDRTCIPPGVDYESYLKKSIRKSKVFLFIASKSSWKSVWGIKELKEFLDNCDIKRLFILKIDKFPIPESEHSYIDGIANLYAYEENIVKELAIEIVDICREIELEDSEDSMFPSISPVRAFISHSHCDNKLADELYSFLRSNGIDCWIDLHDISGGIPYAKAIMDGLQKCQCLIVIFSKNVINSEDILNEIEIAHNNRMSLILPFIIDETPIEGEYKYYLARRQWIQAYPSPSSKFNEILTAISQVFN